MPPTPLIDRLVLTQRHTSESKLTVKENIVMTLIIIIRANFGYSELFYKIETTK